MRSGTFVSVSVVVGVLVAGCEDSPGVGNPDNAVRVVNLNAAMGYRIAAGDSAGTDATEEDLGLLADDLLKQHADIANLQEMAKPAAESLRDRLASATGDVWELNWAHAVNATYYPGEDEDEAPTYENVSTGNAQLVRIGDGVLSQEPITLDQENDDQGILLPSDKGDGNRRSFQGAEITTAHGVVDVYNTHLTLAEQFPDEDRARDVRRIQEVTESRANPVVLTGDFNQEIDYAAGQPHPNPRAVDAVRSFLTVLGYTDVARDKGPTSDRKPESDETPFKEPRRIDYILTRGVRTLDTVKFVSHESDHWGLATTIGVGSPDPS